MTNRESKFSRPSAATHRLTQASTTLNRRYVKRPTVIAINQTSSDTEKSQPALRKSTPATPRTPQAAPGTSRLVNLGVHAKDLTRPVPTAASSTTSTIKVSVKSPAQPVQASTKPAAQPAPKVPAQSAAQPTPKSSTPCETVISRANQDTFGLQSRPAQSTQSAKATQPAPQSTKIKPTTAQTQPAPKAASATQLDTLKAFAAEVKLHPDSADMQKLSATIDKFINVMEKSDQTRTAAEAKLAATVTTSPKITRAAAQPTAVSVQPTAATSSQRATTVAPTPTTSNPTAAAIATPAVAKPSVKSTPDLPAQAHPLQRRANHRLQSAKSAARPTPKSTSSKDIKDRAIKQALRSVATMSEAPAQPIKRRKSGGAKRFILAFTCAAACLAAIIYFVSSNIPDVSVRVAAMQTGIEASYPSYVPMDYSLSDIISEDGKLTMIFNGPDDARFTLVQEKSSWDSATLLRNYVEPTWGSDYVTTHEQGITIYISNQTNDSTWVNGGIRYSITSEGTRLTKKQTRNIVLSL